MPAADDMTVVSHVRGTLLVASRDQLRASGRFAEYESFLSREVREELDAVLVASWQRVSLASEHYSAVDQLGFTDTEVAALTASAAEKLHGIFLSTLSKMVRSSGVTPWSVVPLSGKIWNRLFVGGAVAVAQEGPKDARIVVAGLPLIKSRYLRVGLAQHLATAIRFVVASRPYVQPQRLDLSRGRAEFLIQWV
jgi:hypothetical protein